MPTSTATLFMVVSCTRFASCTSQKEKLLKKVSSFKNCLSLRKTHQSNFHNTRLLVFPNSHRLASSPFNKTDRRRNHQNCTATSFAFSRSFFVITCNPRNSSHARFLLRRWNHDLGHKYSHTAPINCVETESYELRDQLLFRSEQQISVPALPDPG